MIAIYQYNPSCRNHVQRNTKGPHANLHALTRDPHTCTIMSEVVSCVGYRGTTSWLVTEYRSFYSYYQFHV
ncbi:hypothetical protein HKD37_02G004070 [Glycine soja]